METQFSLITIPSNINTLDKTAFADYISTWFKENGTIAFEHGYNHPKFGYNYNTIRIDRIDSEGLHGRNTTNNATCRLSYERLTLSQLHRIIHIVNDYFLYCMYEA